MSDYPYQFEAKIEKYDFGKMFYSVVYVPEDVLSQIEFGKTKRLRIEGEVNGIRIQAAMMPTKGKWYIMISKKLQKLCGATLGEVASIDFEIADQDSVTVPTELQFALEASPAAHDVWQSWTAGKRRSWCHRVATAKMSETRERRVEEVLDAIRNERKRS